MLRKILITILILVCLAFGIALYFYFFRPDLLTKIIPYEQAPTGSESRGSSWLFPFNRLTPDTIPNNQNEGVTPIAEEPIIPNIPISKRPRLWQVYDKPVGGFYASSTSATSSTIRFSDRGNGHLYEVHLQTGSTTKISNTTILKTYSSVWSTSGKFATLSFIRENDIHPTHSIFSIVSRIARQTPTSTPETTYTTNPIFTARDIENIIPAPKSDRFISVRTNSTGASIALGNFSNPLSVTNIFSSPMPLWNISWPTEDIITLTTKAHGYSSGYAYTLNTKTREFTKVISAVPGLTTLTNKDASKILFTESSGRGLITRIYSLKDKSVLDTVTGTIADKCVWSSVRINEVLCAVPSEPAGSLLPDDWYKGLASFNDDIWYINAQTGETLLLVDLLEESGIEIDVINPTLDPRENYLVFMNKKDLTLWAFDLND